MSFVKWSMHALLVAFIVVMTATNVWATDEKYAAPPLTGAGNQIAKDSSCIVQDTVFYNPALRPLQTTFSVRNIITFRLDEFAAIAVPDTFKVTITFKVYFSKLVGGSVVLDSSALQTMYVEYNKFRNYQSRSAYTFTGGYRAEVKIFSVTAVSSSGVMDDYKGMLLLENQIEVNREYQYDPHTDVITSISGELGNPATENSCISEGEYLVYWNKIPSADEYDLEWTYIDSSAMAGYLDPFTNNPDPRKIFANNATRVSIQAESYQVPMLYEHSGILFYRVRPVSIRPSGQRIESVWSSQFSGGLGSYEFEGHETGLNWQASTSYAEDGKRKSVVQYFDGSLRNRQTVTKDNSTCFTIVAETLYDYQGRPAIQVLPAPTLSKLIQYNPAFNVDVNNAVYEKELYDPDTTGGLYNCNFYLPGMGTSSGASKYYSAANSLVNTGYHKYIPDAQLYPFTETRYTPDQTGRVAMQGGVGKQFQINLPDPTDNNNSHESRYFYGSADQEELDALFGTEAGNASHYSKNMVKDANGQYSVSYVDMHGRTIATALAGKPKASMDTLLSSNHQLIQKRLLDTSNNLVNGTSIVSTKTLIVTRPGMHRFEYSLLPDSISIKACDSVTICYDCIYDLDISITNDCAGSLPVRISRTNMTLDAVMDTVCNALVAFPVVDTSVNLAEGSYTITKTLVINQAAKEKYEEIFLRRNTCKTLQDFIDEQQQILLAGLACYASCESCTDSLGTWATYRNRYMMENLVPIADSAQFREQALLAYQAEKKVCDELCNQTGMHTSIRDQMIDDLTSPYGQYANKDSAFDYYNIFHSPQNDPAYLRFKQIPHGTVFKDAYGRPDSVYNDAGIRVPPTDPSVSAEVFELNFKPGWAETLLPLHPEYCKLVEFEAYAASHLWDERFSKVDTYEMAVDSGFFNPSVFTGLPATAVFASPATNGQDPFVTILKPGLKSTFKDSLMNYAGSGMNAWSLATIMAICEPGDAGCVTAHESINNALSVADEDCSTDRDFIWRYFREMYLNKKAQFIDKLVQEACLLDPVLLPWQEPNFPNIQGLFNEYAEALTDPGGGADSLTRFIATNCEGYVAQWMAEMAPCNLTLSDSAAIIPRLLAVCKTGGDRDHVFGSSSTAPGTQTTSGDTSFIQVLKDVLGSRYDTTCNVYLITAPHPYGNQPGYTDIAIDDRPDSCQCSKISLFYQQFRASGDASFSAYIQRVTGEFIAEPLLDTLRKACNGLIQCRYLAAPIVLPPVFQCYTGETCIDCTDMKLAFNEFKATFPGIRPGYDETDTVQRTRNRLFERFMNHRFGLIKTSQDYLAFMDTCNISYTGDSSFCDTLMNILQHYQVQVNNQYTPSPDSSGCNAGMIKAYDVNEGGIYHLASWLENGIFQIPYNDSVHFYPGMIYQRQICIDSGIHIIHKSRLPATDTVDYQRWLNNNLGGTYGTTDANYNISGKKISFRLVNGSYDPLLPDSIFAYISISDPGTMFNYSAGPLSTGIQHLGEWVEQKLTIKNQSVKFYINGLRLDSVYLNNWPKYFFSADFSGDGREYQIDWLKMYDGKNRLRYYEDFLGCDQMADQTMSADCYEDCASSFRPYFNSQLGTSYTYAQIVSLYNTHCQITPDPCYREPVDCNHIKQAVVDYYSSLFNVTHDSSGLEKNVWSLHYNYIARDMTQYSLKDFIRNGIVSTPDSVTYMPGDFSYGFAIPMCVGNAFTLESKVRVKPGFSATTMQLMNNFFMDDNGRPIVQFTGFSDFDGFQGKYYDNGNEYLFADWSQELMHDVLFPEWRVMKVAFRDNRIFVYIDDTLRGNIFYPGNFNSIKFSLLGRQGTPIEIDYVKVRDRYGVVKYTEEFNDFTHFTKVPFEFICPPINCSSSFTGFYNTRFGTTYTYDDIVRLFKATCNIHLEPCGPATGPLLCGSQEPVFYATEPPSLSPCADSTLISTGVGTLLYNAYIDSLKNLFHERYLQKCLQARYHETFTVTAPVSEFHYTLYYYDQAGNLVKTVPPAGVDVSKFGWAVAYSDSVKTSRAARQLKVPAHSLATHYRYNSLNQVVTQHTPDAGLSAFWYDRLGRLVLSQNAEQKLGTEANSLYSYTRYDYLGRIAEVGQVRNNNGAEPVTSLLTRNQALLEPWLTARTAYRGQITETVYDLPYAGFFGEEHNTIRQRNLRNRVSYTSYTDSASMSAFNQASFYSYDIHGNVDTLLQDYGPLTGVRNIMNIQVYNSNRWKRMVYRYDLISGKVNHVAYQPPRGNTYYPDMFYHRYEYDAENRLVMAETSRDSVMWEKEARYEYYRHGPLARVVTGDQLVQGTDYAYSLQGWLKGVNSISSYEAANDMGEDGKPTGIHPFVARDAYGFNLNYHAGDYTAINNTVLPFPASGTFLPANEHRPLYNGNINSMAVNIQFPNPTSVQTTQLYNYKYDQLNRITGMDVYRGFAPSTNTWSGISATTDYKERISYDGNGNILKYLRNGISGISSQMDSLSYHYYSGTNRLKYVRDNVGDGVYNQFDHSVEDINNQTNTGNYTYSEIGNLEKDVKDSIKLIKWNVYGKITEIQRTASTARPVTNIKYTYDASGNRISKRVVTNQNNIAEYTWYVRDAGGNVMATYTGSGQASTTLFSSNYNLQLGEQHIYGSSRVGVLNRNFDVKTAYVRPSVVTFERGNKFFELSNHLGNVLVTISDKKIGVDANSDGVIDYYTADVVTANDFYPGGMVMPGRKHLAGSSSYRYGFGGMEMSNEIKGEGNSYTAEFWEYDPRLVRRWNVDPVTKKWESPYAAFSNNPILNIDPHGDSDSTYKTPGGGTITTETSTAETFTGGAVTVGKGKNKITIHPEKGTLRSFIATDPGFEGGSARYVALFDPNTGAFTGYGWDKNLKSTYNDYLKAAGEDLLRNLEHANDPMWDPNISHAQGAKNAVNLGLSLIVANPLAGKATNLINKAGTANNTQKSSRVLLNTAKKLQAKFKHAIDFGVKGNYSKATAAQFSAALNQHINAARVIQGTYKGQAVIHYLNPTTGVNVITKTTGEFISGWKLGAGQLQGVLKNGTLW